jgi:hypothetical protein
MAESFSPYLFLMNYWSCKTLDDLDGEKWRPIPGYQESYWISNLGRVLSLYRVDERGRLLRDKILNQNITDKNYLTVDLYSDKEPTRYFVHVLMIKTWFCTNHKNGNTMDNTMGNLESITYSENTFHSYRVLGRINGMKGKFGIKRIDSKAIVQRTMNGDKIAEFSSVGAAALATKAQAPNIRKCLKGLRNSAGGFVWEYI